MSCYVGNANLLAMTSCRLAFVLGSLSCGQFLTHYPGKPNQPLFLPCMALVMTQLPSPF